MVMKKKLMPFALVIGLLCGCDGSAPPHAEVINGKAPHTLAGFPSAYGSLPKKSGGACAFDQLNVEGGNRLVSGWAAISTKDGALAEAIVVGVQANKTEKFAVASKQKRDDVARYFSSPALIDSGFSLYIKMVDAPVGSRVVLYQVFQGVVYTCDTAVLL